MYIGSNCLSCYNLTNAWDAQGPKSTKHHLTGRFETFCRKLEQDIIHLLLVLISKTKSATVLFKWLIASLIEWVANNMITISLIQDDNYVR